MAENVEFIADLADLVKKHYPDGKMRVDDITIYFGLVLAGAMADQPEDVRDRAARVMAQYIRHPNDTLRQLVQ